MALSRLRIEAQKERLERDKKEREAQGLTIGQASQIRQEALKEKEAKRQAGIPESLPSASELRAAARNDLRSGNLIHTPVSRNATQNTTRNAATIQQEIDELTKQRDELRRTQGSFLNSQRWSGAERETSQDIARRVTEMDNQLYNLMREKRTAEYITDALGKEYDDNFFGQFAANYRLGRINQDVGAAYNDWLNNDNESIQARAQALAMLQQQFQEQNADVLDDDGWVRKTAAGYLPQFFDQTAAQAGGGALGFMVGGVGGARVGASVATSAQSLGQMQGAAFQALLAEGFDEETAREAARDEGFLSALIEGAGTYLSFGLNGSKMALNAAANAALKNGTKNAAVQMIASKLGTAGVDKIAKEAAEWAGKSALQKAGAAIGGAALNAGGEYLEEAAQEAVSIANKRRENTGFFDLVKESGGVAWDAVTGKDTEARGQMHEAGTEGFKIGLMFGGTQTAVNAAVTQYANAKTRVEQKAVVKTILEDKESLDALIQEGKETGSESAKIAGEIEGKTLRGETVTEKDVERLIAANDVYIQEEVKNEASLRHIEDSADGDTVDTEAAKATREALKPNYGEHGTKAFESIAGANNVDRNELMVRFDKPYQAGLTGLEMKDVELINDFQREAYNAGRLDYIMRRSKDAEHTPGVIHSEEESGFDFTDAPKSLTQAEKNFANFYAKKMGVKGSWDGKNGNAEYNAFYDSSTGGVTFAQDFGIDPKLMERLGSEDFMKKVERLESERDGSFVFYVGHEIATHVAMNRAPAEMRAFVNAMYNYKQGQTTGENLARSKQTFYASKKVDLDTEGAIEEVVADTILELYNGDENAFMEAMYRIANGKDEQAKKGARTFGEMLNDIIRKLKAWARKLTGRENAEARAKAEQGISELEHLRDMFEQAIGASMKAVETARQNPGKQTAANVGEIKNSIKGFATAAGIEASRDADGRVIFTVDGKVVTQVTDAHIREKSSLGGLITTAMDNGFISDKEAEIQYIAAADIMNMIIRTQDPEMVWAWVGSSMFSAIKSNADGQYGTTVDFTTVCRKTQDMITAMSKAMMKLKRGLTKDEVTQLQAKLITEGSSVPCPVCYVFSRWAGIGSVLDNMYRWQDKYDGYTEAQLNEQIATLTEKLGKGKARELAKLLREQDEEYDQLSFEKEKLALEKKQLTSKKKTAVKNNDARTLVDVNNRLAEIDKRNPQINKRMKSIKDSVAPELAWLLQVRTQPDYDTRGKVRANVLFNLDDAATFAEEFPLAWKYRTSRGPSAGKAILPYSDMRAGDIILGVGNTSADGNTAFANATGKFTTEQKAYVEKAIKRAKAQNLIGGQRFQSTSDFRYDYALDYLMAFWECQAIGSKMQTYTKIIEFGDMVAAVGGDFNLSVMPRNKGYITLPNGKNQLVFSSVTGIDFEAAKRSNEMHDNGQLILVGINDEHILAALEDSEETRGSHIGFVIPYHASGASINEFIRVLVSNLGETYMAKSYQDYSDVQSDKERKNATADQKRRNDLRTKLLRGKDGGKNWEPSADDLNFIRGESKSIVGRSFAELREIERKALRGDKAAIAEYESWTAGVLWDLYNKMWMKDGGEYGVRLNTAQAKAVMPHEYWNKTVNRDQAYINGFLFRSYCYNLGLTPRFTGAVVKGEKHGDFADSKGYWKTLIDRPMYRNDGTYRDQQIVNMSTFNQEMLKADYAKKNWEGYSVQEPDVARATRAAEKFVEKVQSEITEASDGNRKWSLRTKPAPKKTVEVYKLMRLENGKIKPLFIDSTEELTPGLWYDADSPNLDFLKKLPSGIFLVDANTETYITFDEYLAKSGEKKKKYPSKKAIEKAAAEGKRWVYIEDVVDKSGKPKQQRRYGGETRKYWNLGINGSGSVNLYAMRPGYHAGSLPTMRQIGKGPNKDLRDDTFVWTVGEVPADIDYQAEANRNPDKDIPTHIPVDGYYLKATNADKAKSQADVMGWYVAGSYKINRIISDAEARSIIDKWNAEHPNAQALYDYERESGMDFDADLMKLVPKADKKYSLKDDDGGRMERELNSLRQQREDLQDEIDVAYLDDIPQSDINKLEARMAKLNVDIDKLVAQERRAAVKTSMNDILANLSRYRRSDLESMAEQISDGNWDGYEDLTRDELEEALREEIDRLELSPLEMQSKRDGLYVRPVSKEQFSLKGEKAMRREIERIRAEGEKVGKSAKEIERDVISTVGPEYGALLKAYGEFDRGEKVYREIKVPKQSERDRKVSQTVRTILEARVTPNAAVPKIQEMVVSGDFSYDVYTDEAAMTIAEDEIRHKGYSVALADWILDVEDGKVSKTNTAIGWALYNAAAGKGDLETAMTVLNHMVGHQRNAAQAVQATRILKKMEPDAQLYGVVKSVQDMETKLNEGKKDNTAEAKKAAGEVGKAKKDAADAIGKAADGVKVKRRGKRVEIDSNMVGEPFVFEYAQKVGEALAAGLEKRANQTEKRRTFLQEITAQLNRFADEKFAKAEKGKKPTAIDLLRDYIQNQSFYAEAWQAAQIELREKFADNEMFREFINSGIGVDANTNPQNAIFMQALVKSAMLSKEGKAMLRKQDALGFTGMANTIAETLIAQTGATGEMADTIRDAAHAYVYDTLAEAKEVKDTTYENWINSALRDIGVKLSDVVMTGTGESAKRAIVDKLVGKYGFGLAEATHTADVVSEHFDRMSRKFAENRLEAMFKERNNVRKTIPEQIERLARLGAFDAGSIYNEKAAERIFKTGTTLTVNEDLARQFLMANTQEERDNILADIYRDIGRQMPATFVDKWNAWRYLAMLGNPRTHVRNILGNAFFAPVVATKDLTATGIERAVNFVSRGKLGRTKAMPGRELLKAAWADYENVADEISGGGKYSDAAMKNKFVEEGRVIFKTKALEKARRGNSAALEAEDVWFAKPHYAFALAQYCKAHGVTADQLRRGKALGNARAYAIKEAQKATYRDTNAFSETISELGRYHGDNAVKKGVSVAMEGILPFRKTPANILVRGLEYSPMGLLKSLTWDLAKVKKGDITGAEAIDNIAAGMTGTMLLGLGVWAAAEGLIRGAGGDDDDEKKYEELQGHQAYALELPDGTSVTLDWLAPEALPMFVGVNLYEMARDNKGKSNLADILTAVSNVTEPLLEMSCLQSLNDVFDSVGYASTNGLHALPSALVSAATSYLTQAFPTILGQAERSAQDVRMTTYTEKDGFLTGDMQYTLGKISARLPGWDFQQIPYVDAWGRTESTGSRGENIANNFLNPAYMSQIETSAMEEELQRLYDATGEKSVLPDRADKKFTVNKEDKHLTAEEYVEYATERGQIAYDLLSDITSRTEYRNASDADKVDLVEMAYEYANAIAKTKVSDYKPTGWVKTAIEAEKKTGMDETEYMLYKLALSTVDQPNKSGEYGTTPTQEEKAAAIALRQDLSDAAIASLWDTEDGYDLLDAGIDMRAYTEYVGTGGSVNAEKLIDMHSKGIEEDTYFDFLDKLKEVNQQNKNGSVKSYDQDEATEAVKAIPGLTKEQRSALWKSVSSNWANSKNNPWR